MCGLTESHLIGSVKAEKPIDRTDTAPVPGQSRAGLVKHPGYARGLVESSAPAIFLSFAFCTFVWLGPSVTGNSSTA